MTSEVLDALYEETQGIIVLAVVLYVLLQEDAIRSEKETFSVEDIHRVARERMALVQPMIKALRENDQKEIDRYEDITDILVNEVSSSLRDEWERDQGCRTGSAFAAGQAKRINRECGFSKSHKKNLWYCPPCVREDLTGHGETCWRRLPQMPGAVYCPVHRERFRESGVSFSETGYQLIPATYALIHRPDPEQGNGTIYSDQYIELSRDIAWHQSEDNWAASFPSEKFLVP